MSEFTAFILDTTGDGAEVTDGLILTAHGSVADPHHGVYTVHVTAEDFTRFIAAWRSVDPNGTWGEVLVEAEGMHYRASDACEGDDDEHFPLVGATEDGTPLYAVNWWFIPSLPLAD